MNGIASSAVDPFAPDFLMDPYPAYAALRALGPVFELERYGVWAMAGYAEVEPALKDWKTFISGEGVGLHGMNPALPKPLTLQIDPPDHDKGRRVLGRTLSPGVARKLRETFQREAEKKVSELIDKGTLDAVADLAEAYPMKVFPDAIGIRPDGREKLLAWSTFVFNSFGPENEILAASRQEGLAAQSWIMECCARDALRPDSLGTMIYGAADEGEITEHEATHLVRPFLTAGVDTTVNGIGNTLLALATHPDEYRKLHQKPELARNAFEEGLRYDSPVQTFFRTTSREVEIGGGVIPAHRKVLLFMASANRDPARWDRADRFNVERATTGHVGFGAGIHACVGQMIARLEGELIFGELARRVKTIELKAEPKRRLNNSLRGLESMLVRLTAA